MFNILAIPSWIADLPPTVIVILACAVVAIIIAIAATLVFLVTSNGRTENFIRIATVFIRPFYRTRERIHVRVRKNRREEEHTLYFQLEPEMELHTHCECYQKVIEEQPKAIGDEK